MSVTAHRIDVDAELSDDKEVAAWKRDIAKRLRNPRTRAEFSDNYVAKLY